MYLQVSPELGNHYSDVLAAQDVALYGGLCALASFDRSEIKRHVVESIGFREMLELNPEVRAYPSRHSQPVQNDNASPLGSGCYFPQQQSVRKSPKKQRYQAYPSLQSQVREVVYDFYCSRFASCLARLQQMLPVLRLDIFLSPHVEALYEAVNPASLLLSLTVSLNVLELRNANAGGSWKILLPAEVITDACFWCRCAARP